MERVPSVEIVDRYKGTLVGVAVGDALGQPVEFLVAKNKLVGTPLEKTIKNFLIDLRINHQGKVTEMLNNPLGYWKKGEFTDDTSQTLLLTYSLIEKGYDPDDFVDRLMDWFNKGKAKGMGSTTINSLSLIQAGLDWREMSTDEQLINHQVPTNGSLMRTSPIGLYFRTKKASISDAASEISRITHYRKEAIVVCQIASHLIAQLSSGIPKKEALNNIEQMFKEDFKKIEYSYRSKKKHAGGAYESLVLTLNSFGNAKSFEEAVVYAINQEGDSDTYGAITGAFAGAYWGIEKIPDRWIKELKPINGESISNIADLLYQAQAN